MGRNPDNIIQAERRVVSMLSADIVGSSRLISDLSPDDAAEFLDPLIDCMTEAAHTFGGKVMRVEGDGIKVVYGAEGHQEKHAALAVLTGLKLLEDKKSLALKKKSTPKIRVGIHSGYALVRWQSNDFGGGLDLVGSTAHICSKVEESGQPDTVTISSETKALIENLFDFQDTGKHVDSSKTFEITKKSLSDDSPIFLRSQPKIPLYGREDECHQILAHIFKDDLNKPLSISLKGEAGIGKTRILQEVYKKLIKENVRVEILESDYIKSDTPYYGIKQLARKLLSITENSSVSQVKSQIDTLGVSSKIRSGLSFLLLPEYQKYISQASPPEEMRDGIRDALKFLLRTIAQTRKFVVIVEDLHWLDQESYNCLLYTLKSMNSHNFKLLLSARPSANKQIQLLEGVVLNILPLTKNSANQLVRYALLKSMLDSDSIIDEIIERSNGLPFALIEFSKSVKKDENLPIAVEPFIRSKFDELNREERAAINLVSVFGMEANSNDLAKILGLDHKKLTPVLANLVRSGLLNQQSRYRFSFVHQLYQTVCYNALPRKTASLIHASILEFLQKAKSRDPQILAFHANNAKELSLALNYLEKACLSAVSTGAIRTIKSLYFRAAKICDEIDTPDSQVRKVQFALQSYFAFQQLAEENELAPLFEDALKSDMQDWSPAEIASIRCNLSTAKWHLGDITAIEQSQLALEAAKTINNPRDVLRPSFLIANCEFSSGKPKQAAERLMDIIPKLPALNNEEKSSNLTITHCHFRVHASWFLADIGDNEAALALYNDARTIADETQHVHSQLICDMNAGYLAYLKEDYPCAVSYLDGVYERCLKNGHYGFAPLACAWHSIALSEQGLLSEAEDVLNQELENKLYLNRDNFWRYYVRLAKANIAYLQQDYSKSEDLLIAAIEHIQSKGDLVHEAYAHFEYARFMVKVGFPLESIRQRLKSAETLAVTCRMKPLKHKIRKLRKLTEKTGALLKV